MRLDLRFVPALGRALEHWIATLVCSEQSDPASSFRPVATRSCVRLSDRIDKTLSSTISPWTRLLQ